MSKLEGGWSSCSHLKFRVCDSQNTVFPIYPQHPAINSGRVTTFHCRKLENTSLLLNRRISERERHHALKRTFRRLSL
ncbi:hypothetical protein TNIN_385501 [Trichonephila inaurata madagascariensis]|uniref:Uncharacterized protein n=1 Tax=Trichonephila inaurata madagascariensis TaxID=2747483 RepID=A0A8X7CN94_9ARAC|nr:hypothetical protein TNIN_385501 [Trichonephila inaurata madagascariensis]